VIDHEAATMALPPTALNITDTVYDNQTFIVLSFLAACASFIMTFTSCLAFKKTFLGGWD
jgi:hypothetical protein